MKTARKSMLADPKIRDLIGELSAWPGKVIASHKSASQPFHKLTFVADLGLKACDPKMDKVLARVLKHQSAEGPFQLPLNIPTHFGGNGEAQWAWALCDAPLLVYALVKFGLESDPAVKKAVAYLAGLHQENGWHCVVSKELGKFRGPGRKDDPCPFATLAVLKALSEVEGRRDSRVCKEGANTVLTLWEKSTTSHPYMFFMGTDFRKPKVPFVWYDLVHVLDVMSRFSWLRKDPRVLSMLSLLKSKADSHGRFTGESVWTAWKDWEFGQKKEPSRWLSLSTWRIIQRIEGISV